MSIEAIFDEEAATFAVRPEHGKPVTFEVRHRELDVAGPTLRTWGQHRFAHRFVVGLKGSSGHGFAHFTSFEAACRSALYRARRYERAYSVPRGVAS